MVARWVENPYYQYFCGETFFPHSFPLAPSSLTRWRKRIGEEGYTGRVMRDIQRQLDDTADSALRQRIQAKTALADRLLRQKPKDKGKLYALHEPEVDCISKGKARLRYEFGTKVSIATTHKEGFVVGMRSMPGNPYDGLSLREALEQVEIMADTRPKWAFVDRGDRGHGVQITAVYIAGQKRGVNTALRRDLRRRSVIEPNIGHMKIDGRLSRCAIKGTLGDALHASCAAAATTSG